MLWKYDRDRNSVWEKNSRETMHNIRQYKDKMCNRKTAKGQNLI